MIALLAAVLVAQDAFEKPGKEHEFLKNFEGEWESTAKFMMGPEPAVSKGKETCRLVGGGLFLLIDTDSDMFGGKFYGHGTMGYDVHKKKYTGSWIDNMATGVYLVEGTLDESGKVLTEWMEGTHPRTGETFKMKMIHTVKDKNSRSLRFLMPTPDGKEMETGAIVYTRKK